MSIPRAWAVIAAFMAALAAPQSGADDSPAPPPPQHQWIGKGQFGFLDSKGNSDSESANASIDLSRTDGDWKNALYVGGLYGKSGGIVSAERWEVREQTDYNFTSRFFAFGGLRYEHDLFDGFEYQVSVTGGPGYKFIDTVDDKLTAQLGAGFRRLRPETLVKDDSGEVVSRTPLNATGEAIGTVGIDYFHRFTDTTSLTNTFLLETGSTDTLLHDQVAVAVKMSNRLALSVGYGFTDNSHPAAPLKKVDTVTTVNLVFAF